MLRFEIVYFPPASICFIEGGTGMTTSSARLGLAWEQYWSRFLPYFLITLAVFGLGLLFGSLATEVLTVAERVQLNAWLQRMISWERGHLFTMQVYRSAVITNLKGLGLLYLLGISVAGIPLVLAMLFLRGFVVGFALAFLEQQTQATGHGLGIVLAALVTQNLFLVPLYVMTATLGLWFAWTLLATSQRDRVRPFKALATYTVVCFVLALGMFWATAVEVVGSPFLLQVSRLIH